MHRNGRIGVIGIPANSRGTVNARKPPERPAFGHLPRTSGVGCLERFGTLHIHGAPAMIDEVKRSWQRFKAGHPGRRFRKEFIRRRFANRSLIQKALLIVGGLLLVAAGFLLLFIPGPGLVVLLIGGFLIAQQSLIAARTLDRIEIRLRNLLAVSGRRWRRSSLTLKVLFVVVVTIVAGVIGFGAFKFLIFQA